MAMETLLVVVGKLLAFLAAYLNGLYIGVLLHELGHAVAVLLTTRQRAVIRVGLGDRAWSFELGSRLSFELGRRRFRYGSTSYDRSAEGRRTQAVVALSGPLTTLAAVVLCVWWMRQFYLGAWPWAVAFGLFLANLRLLVSSLWPVAYRPFPDSDEVWLSDSLDIWRLLRSRE